MKISDFMPPVRSYDRVKKSTRNSHTYRAARREEAKRRYRSVKRKQTET